jgi:5'-deoxynucleotidase YfbR-like HD superfamily hydrolase
MRLPTEEQCFVYFDEYKVPRNIYDHCLRVKKLAVLIAEKLNHNGVNINVPLVRCGALLHDLFKVVALKDLSPNSYHSYKFSEEETEMWKKLRDKYPQMYEGEVAYIVFNKDFPELALLLKNVSDPKLDNRSWEEDIVHYADWRTLKSDVVSVHDRLKYLQEVYKKEAKQWESDVMKITSFENKIMSILNMQPEKLAELIEEKI